MLRAGGREKDTFILLLWKKDVVEAAIEEALTKGIQLLLGSPLMQAAKGAAESC